MLLVVNVIICFYVVEPDNAIAPEESGDLFESFVLGFWDFTVGESPKECEEDAERKKCIVSQQVLRTHRRKR